MTQFRHLNHIVNINDPFTLSQAECNLKPFSGSFIGGLIVLRLRPQSTQEKLNWSSLHCNTSGGNKHQLVVLSLLVSEWELLPDTGPQLRLTDIQMNQRGKSSCQAFNNRKMRNETSRPAVTSALSLAKRSQNTWPTLYLHLKPTVSVSNATVTSNNSHLIEFSSSAGLSRSSSGSSHSFVWHNGGSEVEESDRVHLAWWRLHSHHN